MLTRSADIIMPLFQCFATCVPRVFIYMNNVRRTIRSLIYSKFPFSLSLWSSDKSPQTWKDKKSVQQSSHLLNKLKGESSTVNMKIFYGQLHFGSVISHIIKINQTQIRLIALLFHLDDNVAVCETLSSLFIWQSWHSDKTVMRRRLRTNILKFMYTTLIRLYSNFQVDSHKLAVSVSLSHRRVVIWLALSIDYFLHILLDSEFEEMASYKVEAVASSPISVLGEGPHWDVEVRRIF